MNREQILEWLDRPAELDREERLIRLLVQESKRAERLQRQIAFAAVDAAGKDGSADAE